MAAEFYTAECYYAKLGVQRTADEKSIKKAYRKIALAVHPDKNEDKEKATADFKLLTHIYSVLTTKRKREIYDRTGSYSEEDDAGVPDSFEEAYDYWRERFREVTALDIEEFRKTYKGSAEEREDLASAYTKCKGDVRKIFHHVPLSEPADDQARFVEILDGMIADKTVKRYAAFARTRGDAIENEYASEAAEAEELRKKLKVKKTRGDAELAAMIVSRKRGHANALGALAAKYAGGAAAALDDDDDPLAGVDLDDVRSGRVAPPKGRKRARKSKGGK